MKRYVTGLVLLVMYNIYAMEFKNLQLFTVIRKELSEDAQKIVFKMIWQLDRQRFIDKVIKVFEATMYQRSLHRTDIYLKDDFKILMRNDLYELLQKSEDGLSQSLTLHTQKYIKPCRFNPIEIIDCTSEINYFNKKHKGHEVLITKFFDEDNDIAVQAYIQFTNDSLKKFNFYSRIEGTADTWTRSQWHDIGNYFLCHNDSLENPNLINTASDFYWKK
jgi:predicted kinase